MKNLSALATTPAQAPSPAPNYNDAYLKILKFCSQIKCGALEPWGPEPPVFRGPGARAVKM